jgi:hypothetical protein
MRMRKYNEREEEEIWKRSLKKRQREREMERMVEDRQNVQREKER